MPYSNPVHKQAWRLRNRDRVQAARGRFVVMLSHAHGVSERVIKWAIRRGLTTSSPSLISLIAKHERNALADRIQRSIVRASTGLKILDKSFAIGFFECEQCRRRRRNRRTYSDEQTARWNRMDRERYAKDAERRERKRADVAARKRQALIDSGRTFFDCKGCGKSTLLKHNKPNAEGFCSKACKVKHEGGLLCSDCGKRYARLNPYQRCDACRAARAAATVERSRASTKRYQRRILSRTCERCGKAFQGTRNTKFCGGCRRRPAPQPPP